MGKCTFQIATNTSSFNWGVISLFCNLIRNGKVVHLLSMYISYFEFGFVCHHLRLQVHLWIGNGVVTLMLSLSISAIDFRTDCGFS